MGETLNERRRVGDEGLRVVKPCRAGKKIQHGEQSWDLDGTAEGSSG